MPLGFDPSSLLDLATKVAALGAAGILALVLILFVLGRLHSDPDYQRDVAYREMLRKEAVEDRRASDDRAARLTDGLKETNELTQRALDLMERSIERRNV